MNCAVVHPFQHSNVWRNICTPIWWSSPVFFELLLRSYLHVKVWLPVIIAPEKINVCPIFLSFPPLCNRFFVKKFRDYKNLFNHKNTIPEKKVKKRDFKKVQNWLFFRKVENWKSGKLENFKSGKVENWKIRKLKNWKSRKWKSCKCRKLEKWKMEKL